VGGNLGGDLGAEISTRNLSQFGCIQVIQWGTLYEDIFTYGIVYIHVLRCGK